MPLEIPAGKRTMVRMNLHATEAGPIEIDMAFWSAEGQVLQRVPLRIRGEAR